MILARERWMFSLKGRTFAAALFPSFFWRFSSEGSSDIRAILRPEKTADATIKNSIGKIIKKIFM
jgi:hypothetical protein